MRRRNDGLTKDLALLAAAVAVFIAAQMAVYAMDIADAKAVEQQKAATEIVYICERGEANGLFG